MGNLMKEALKSICGVNQWSYAIFWKIGRQNPKLLIWEDCYYEVTSCSVLPSNSKIGNQGLTLGELEKCWVSPEAYTNELGARVSDRVDFLVNKMIIANQVHVVGEGLVGRTAFTGTHQWIVSGNFSEGIHPPQVVNELQIQFSAGMQTVAVIPAIPLGVIQLGSSLAIRESTQFVCDVKSLIHQLVPDDYVRYAFLGRSGLPFNQVASASLDSFEDSNKLNYSTTNAGPMQTDLIQDSRLGNQSYHSLSSKVEDHLEPTASTFLIHDRNLSTFQGDECQPSRNADVDSLRRQSVNEVLRPEVLPFRPDLLLNQGISYNLCSGSNNGQPLAIDCGHNLLKRHLVLDAGYGECTQNKSFASGSEVQSQLQSQFSEPYAGSTSGTWAHIFSLSNKIVDQSIGSGVPPGGLHPEDDMHKYKYIPDMHGEKDLYKGLKIALSKEIDHLPCGDFVTGFNKMHSACDIPSCETALSEIKSSMGDELFDALGLDFKKKIRNSSVCKVGNTRGANMIGQVKEKSQDLTSILYPNCCDRISESGILSASGSDHLLDAVVSGVCSAATQTSDDNVSCRTTMTKASHSSAPGISPMFGQGTISQQMCELFGPCKSFVRSAEIGAICTMSALEKRDTRNCSQYSSLYGSHISSWVEQLPTVKHETTVATANSKKSSEVGKPTCKRLKPRENPRPRPKDRQMIQDRVKELREIVPNGAKCSIDALLEQTIKHMLFLQSVTNHADKLKQKVEFKFVNKEGGLLKDNFEGGATWAYEVGSQAKLCPIVIEDLNTPRQFLVEMLCEERGFFLEIADMIRGMGLTILKGVMETRNDKIWARFSVEANRDVTRMEIFLSLVHLEQTVKK